MAKTYDAWKFISEIDPTINFKEKQYKRVKQKQLYSSTYSRETLFKNMAKGQISVFKDYPIDLSSSIKKKGIHDVFSKLKVEHNIKVNMGPSATVKYKGINEISSMLKNGQAKLGITDLHFRNTNLHHHLDVKNLSYYNVLCRSTEEAKTQEMMTFVVATKGYFTDSHSDDPDGTNHCIKGNKLWLAWDTFEGSQHGIEDVERTGTYGDQASFDLDTFLKLKSSKWFHVKTGETLFLPGHLSHKVFTLDEYYGYGSFYVSLPNLLRTISRWILHRPLWEKEIHSNSTLIDEILKTALNIINRLESSSRLEKQRWGYDFIPISINHWKREYSTKEKKILHADSIFAKLDKILF